MNVMGSFKKRMIIVLAVLIALLPFSSVTEVKAKTHSEYYVSTSGDDTNPGTTRGNPWRTIAYAATQAQAGDTVYIEAGDYGKENIIFSNSGTSAEPIVFIGCDSRWKPVPEPEYYDIYPIGGITPPALDPSEMPYINGLDRTGTGISLENRSYITIQNIQVASYENGVFTGSNPAACDHIILNNIRAYWCAFYNINLVAPDDCQILNCITEGGEMGNILLRGARNCLLENSLSTDMPGDTTRNGTDYYIHLTAELAPGFGRESYGNTVRHCLAQNHQKGADGHSGYGFVVKSVDYLIYDNLIEDCVSNTMASNFQCRHSGVYNNTFKNCIAYDLGVTYGDSGSYVCRDGANNNAFINCRGRHVSGSFPSYGVSMYDSSEDGDNTHSGQGNKFMNCIFEDYDYSINLDYWPTGYNSPASDNLFENCNFINNCYGYFMKQSSNNNENNIIKNSIVTGFDTLMTGYGSGDPIYSYSCFYGNNFSAPAGTGIITTKTLFADEENRDYHLKSQYGRWNGKQWVYDTQTSLCINAGDPVSGCSNEPDPNGGRINIGAYGNTTEASKSSFYVAPTTLPAPIPTPTPAPTPTPPPPLTTLDHNDIGEAGDNDTNQHTPGISLFPNAEWKAPATVDGYTVREAPLSGANLYVNITDLTKKYYVRILYKASTSGKLEQYNGTNYGEIGDIVGDNTWRTMTVLLNDGAYYYDYNGSGSNSATNVMLFFGVGITVADAWLEVE